MDAGTMPKSKIREACRRLRRRRAAEATLRNPDLGFPRKPLVLTAAFRLNSMAAL